MPQEIDFLPQSYREQGKRRQRKLSRYVVVAVIGSMLLSATVWQLQLKWRIQRQIDEVRPLAAATTQQQTLLVAAEQQLAKLEAEARLYAFLKHPWPATQVLAAALRDISPEIQITELRIEAGQAERAPRRLAAPATTVEPEATVAESLTPPEQDFSGLFAEAEATRVIIRMEGVVSDTAALHRYLARVGGGRLIDKAILESLESEGDAAGPTRSAKDDREDDPRHVPLARFRARFIVSESLHVPQPGRPQQEPTEADFAAGSKP